MVQVDVFWSYAIGATFAASASRQLKELSDLSDWKRAFINKYFVYTLLFLSCLFAPSGVYLLWAFPQWETMQVATNRADIPAWLVTLFVITNITQGILGYWVAYKFIQKGKIKYAWLQVIIGYLIMLFILIYGWDGTGWQRFLYDASMHGGALWRTGEYDGISFLKGHVAYTLYGMGIVVGPFLLLPILKWIKKDSVIEERS